MLHHQLSLASARATSGFHCLVLHGLGDSMQGWMPAAPLFGLPDVGFAFADAPLEYYGGFSWFDIGEGFSPDLAQVRVSTTLVEELIAHLCGRLGITADRLFLMGFSQGALMVGQVAMRSASRFAGVIGISGFHAPLHDLPGAFGPAAREQRLLLTHGTDDGMIPIGFARGQKDQLAALGLRVEWREYAKAHSLDQQEIQDIAAWMRERMATAATAKR